MKVVELKDDRVLLAEGVLKELLEMKPSAVAIAYVHDGEVGYCYAGFQTARELTGSLEMAKQMMLEELL